MVSCPHLLQAVRRAAESQTYYWLWVHSGPAGRGGAMEHNLSYLDLNLDGRHHLGVDSTYIGFADL